jgi:dipeptidase E
MKLVFYGGGDGKDNKDIDHSLLKLIDKPSPLFTYIPSLKTLRKKKLLGELKKFVKRGGVLTGLSAGAILMTPKIDTASFPDHDRDDNDCKIRNFNSLNLVDFEFFPHYRNSKRYDFDLLKHSKLSKNPIYACYDGSGIIVNSGKMEFLGKVFLFHRGTKIRIN